MGLGKISLKKEEKKGGRAMTEKVRNENGLTVDSGLDKIRVRIMRYNGGQWSLQFLAGTFEGKRILDAIMAECEYYREHSAIILLSHSSKMYTSTMSVLDFNLDEGPDIVGTKKEIKELKNWKPKEKEKKPPAHKVILRKLQALRDKHLELKKQIPLSESRGSYEFERKELWYLKLQAMALIETLTAMHIPKAARKELADALGLLPASFLPPMAIDIFEEIKNEQ